ncbi:helix-turn-helix transcriptional regulator [Zoogloea sp.]|uniref:helix-turn-helix transcriptional regulator n=1 Tax=Zoogloea sp. TaxID=49181 RepID=UPI0035B0161F
MEEHLIGWRELAEFVGGSATALRQAAHRGKLPLPERWERGNRTFLKAEVQAWLEARKTGQKPKH